MQTCSWVTKIAVALMSYEGKSARAPDETSCRYGASRLQCRGPLRAPEADYLVFMGGAETYGRFVADPFVSLVERDLGRDCVNLGCVNGGLEAYLQDDDLLTMARGADLAVIQVSGAQNLSNRFYRVHPRRNDRFLNATPELRALFPDVDFTEFHFNNHLLGSLYRRSPERFQTVRAVLEQTWLLRMRTLIQSIGVPVMLLWLRYDQHNASHSLASYGEKPRLVRRDMLDALALDCAGLVEIHVAASGAAGETADMRCTPLELPGAGQLIGPAMHRIIADRLLAESALRPRE